MNKNYDVKCKVDHGELYLSITHNGYQWASISIKDREREIPLIISELNKYLTRQSSGRAESFAIEIHEQVNNGASISDIMQLLSRR